MTVIHTADPSTTNVFAQLVDEHALQITVPEGETICVEGEASDGWWYVIDGYADVTREGRYVATIGPDETIGEIAMLDGRPRTATVVATSDMRLWVASASDLLAALEASPRLALTMAKQIAARFRDLSENDVRRSSPARRRSDAAVSPTAPPQAAAPTERVEFNPFAPGYFEDPHVQLGQIREQEAIHPVGLTGAHMFTRYEHVHALARDRRLGVEIAHALPNPAIDAEKAMLASAANTTDSILRTDGDDHSRVRRLMQKPFTPKRIAEWNARAAQVSDDLLDRLEDDGGGDLISDYALMLPVQIISDLLGMPTDQLGDLRDWSHALTKTLDPLCSPEERAASVAARNEINGYIASVYEMKREQPDDGILSTLIEAEDAGERLTRDEVIINTLLLYIAGHETTTNLIGNGVIALMQHPDQLDRLRSDPELDANTVEEVLRYNSPVQLTRRISREDIEVDGVSIPAGSVFSLAGAAANRDPRKWGSTADEFIIDRPGANDHVSFGGGPHFCLGSALARLEGRIALPRLMRRFPKMQFVSEPTFEPRMVLRGVGALQVSTA
jgi:cytochrome P450